MAYSVRDLEVVATYVGQHIGIKEDVWAEFMEMIAQLKTHNEFMYAHSLRVGLYACGISVAEPWNEAAKLALFGGCGHDIGKCRVSNDILNKTAPLTDAEFDIIHRHPQDGYEMLRDRFPFSALIAGLHHKYTPKAYGIELDKDCPEWFDHSIDDHVISVAKQVMICDFFDAITTRRNSGSLVSDPEDMIAVATVLHEYFPQYETRVEWLLTHKIG